MGSSSANPDKCNSLALAYLQGMDPATRQTGPAVPIFLLSPLLGAIDGSYVATTMTGNLTLTNTSVANRLLNPNGTDRTVTLPAEATATGKVFRLRHTGSSKIITVQDDTSTTVRVIYPGEELIVSCDGTAWAIIGYISRLVGDVNAESLAGTKTLTTVSEPIQLLNPNGANRDVNLPAEESALGARVVVKNTGTAYLLTVKSDAPATVRILRPGEAAAFACDGGAWTVDLVSNVDITVNGQTLNADLPLDSSSARVQLLDPNGTPRLVTLPREEDSTDAVFFIRNTATASYLRVRDDTPTVITDVHPGETKIFICDGVAWTLLGSWTDYSTLTVTVMSGTLTLRPTDAKEHRLDPDGVARNVDLPAEADSTGLTYRLHNAGEGVAITVRNDAAATVATLYPGQWLDVICDGTDWLVIGRGNLGSLENEGVVAEARLIFTGNPTDADTLTIGADVYEFDDNVAVTGGRISVTIGGTAGDTLANLIAAINTSGTENVVADNLSNDLRIRSADAPGGNVKAADPSIVLAESITAAGDVWVQGNVNMNTLAGQARAARRTAQGQLTVTTAMITSEPFTVGSFTFTPTGFMIQVRSATGLLKQNVTDLFTLSGARLVCNVDGATNVANTDTITFWVWE